VRDELALASDEFQVACDQSDLGRDKFFARTTIGIADVSTVRVMDGRNRERFAEDGQLLGSWLGASRVLGRPRSGKEPEGGRSRSPRREAGSSGQVWECMKRR
jgi:hypothetical protein